MCEGLSSSFIIIIIIFNFVDHVSVFFSFSSVVVRRCAMSSGLTLQKSKGKLD